MAYYPPGFSKDSSGSLVVFFVFSLVLHGILLFVIPNFLSVKRIEILPVTYISPLEVKIRKLPPLPSRASGKEKVQKPAENKEPSHFIRKKVQAMSVGKGLFLPPPSIQLPTAEILNKENKIEELYVSKKNPKERLGSTPLAMGVPNLLPNIHYEASTVSSPQAEKELTEGIIKNLKREMQVESKRESLIKKKGETIENRLPNVKLGIEGPVSVRRVLYRPALPRVSTEQSVQIKLKFWVAPNGIVDQIIPIERGGTQLEAVAIGFLKKWKFEPLPTNIKQERQWGVLTVKFVVK